MKKATDIIFSALMLLLLLLPTLYFVGVKENFLRLVGAERIPSPVPLKLKTYVSKAFQRNFDEIYGKKFFLRNTFSRCKNQIYAFCNFGYFYYSSKPIFGNRDGWLQGFSYVQYYHSGKQIREDGFQDCFRLLGKLAAELKARNVDFIYVLATDKVLTYPERLPSFYSLYLKKRNGPSPHREYGKILEKYDIPYFDSHAFLYKFRDKVELFPTSGLHWNAPAACLTFTEVLRILNKDKDKAKRYVLPGAVRFEKTKKPYYSDNDLGSLINILRGPKNVGLRPVFAPPVRKNDFDVIVFGDSFSGQIGSAMDDSRLFNKVINYNNRIPSSAEDFRRELSKTKLFVLVYTTPKLFNPLDRHWVSLTIYRMLCLPFGERVPVNEINDSYTQGLFKRESRRGRWAGPRCRIKLPVPAGTKQAIRVTFNGTPLDRNQVVVIRNSRNKILKVQQLTNKGSYHVTVPPEDISKEYFITLNFEFPRAHKPGTNDLRTLSFFFESFMLTPVKSTARSSEDAKEIRFDMPGRILQTGFSAAENWGTWSIAKNCVMQVPLPGNRNSETVRLRFTCQAYNRMKSVKVYCNGKYAAEWKIRKFSPDIYELKLNVPLTERDVELRFEQFDAASPFEVSGAADYRKLGLGFISMKYLPATN